MTHGRRQREKVTAKSTGQGQKDRGTGRTRRTHQTVSQREARRQNNEVMAARVKKGQVKIHLKTKTEERKW